MGQNLGVLSNFPSIEQLPIEREQVEKEEHDFVVGTKRIVAGHALEAAHIVNVNALV